MSLPPHKLRAMADRLEKLNPKINAMLELIEAEYGWEDETAGHLADIAGLLLDAAYECRLKASGEVA